MGWSTRQLAELSGTTLRAVRHYHEVGLLEEPARRANGYKQYGVAHLVRVLRIKRLTDLGFSLAQIAEMGDTEEHPEQALRALDAELAATIERLQRARLELATILQRHAPAALPPELGPLADADMSDADRSLVVVLSRVLGAESLQAYADMIRETPTDPTFTEFDDLPADADEATRQDLAERMAPPAHAVRTAYPAMRGVGDATLPLGRRRAQETVGVALRELYNEAQLDVMVRLEAAIAEQFPGSEGTPPQAR
ncbi:MerR family transcriptional regulator [Actinomycetospora lemnae]|uniref:MerR family transcriptional regulator n=1 Tax=Actinomycetospora lemnae TaxID=3019891 RepID=A0ABT5T2T7_9PSEU|nr:MerR family transcriptional regulator [Actinomycetospora sp. DW7H6]MDD7968253.1 MerR family transcriptional regulator [Actinomycetospora sp. DW7H6]